MKEHLYRQHKPLSYECYRCCAGFDTDNLLRDHQRRPEGCQIGEQNIDKNRITRAQEKELRSKKRSRKNETEEGKWRDIYKIIFPDDTEIPSPYCEVEVQGQLTRFHEFAGQRLDTLVAKQLKRAAEDCEEFQNEELQRKLPKFIRSFYKELSAQFYQNSDEYEVQDAAQLSQELEEPAHGSQPGTPQALKRAQEEIENETDHSAEVASQERRKAEGHAHPTHVLQSRTATDESSKLPEILEQGICEDDEQIPAPQPPLIDLNDFTLSQPHKLFSEQTVSEKQLNSDIQPIGDHPLTGNYVFPFSTNFDFNFDYSLSSGNMDSSSSFSFDDTFSLDLNS